MMLKHRQNNIAWHALASRGFIAALAMLLLNDHVLKATFHNWLTGKLSDFAGLFVFVVFWCAMLPRKTRGVMFASAAGFALWKSSLSEPLIGMWNATGILPVGRVVDYTDLLAIAIIPIAGQYFSRARQTSLPLSIGKPLAIIGAMAMLASEYAPTPIPPPRDDNEPYKAMGVTFPGGNLGRCVEQNASQHDWILRSQVEILDCNFRYDGLGNLSGIEKFPNLRAFFAASRENTYLVNNQIRDLTPLGKLALLEQLNLRGQGYVSNISPLSTAKLLQWIDISGTNVSSLAALENATKLRTIIAENDHFLTLDISPGLPALETFILNGSIIETFGTPTFLSSLKTLNLANVTVTNDTNFLSLAKNLETLDLANTNVGTSFEFLRNMAALRDLRLTGQNITDVSQLGPLKELVTVNLANNKLEALPTFTSQHLTSLNAAGNVITSLEPLTQLSSLATLDLAQNKISDLRPLAGLKLLDSLDLHGNQITNVNSLQYLPTLQQLDVTDNPITDYTPLADHVKRGGNVSLSNDLCENEILHAELAPQPTLTTACTNMHTRIGKLTQLSELVLWQADNSDFSFLKTLTNLRTLAILYTKINDLKFLEDLPALETLTLNGSMAADLTPIAKLSSLNTLEFSAQGDTQIVPSLAHLTNLKQVTIYNCNDAKAWKEKLQIETIYCSEY